MEREEEKWVEREEEKTTGMLDRIHIQTLIYSDILNLN